MHRRACTVAALAATALTALAASPAIAASGIGKGPSTTKSPYILPSADGVFIKSLFTTGDLAAGNGYRYVGIPDGLGAQRDGDDILVYNNHELGNAVGAVRRHGQKGSFVSKLRIDRSSLRVESGSDLINPDVQYWDYPGQTWGATPSAGGANPRNPLDTFLAQPAAFNRFCSSSLTDPGQLYNRRSGRGYTGQIYFANEEGGDESRLFGVTEDGDAKQLPRLGLFSWENTLAANTRSDLTLVHGQEDGPGAGSQLWVYLGKKTKTGDAFKRAGLTNGTSFVLDASDAAVKNDAQFRSTYGVGTPADVELKEVEWDASGKRQNEEAVADGLALNRIEDGAWDPQNPDTFYFVTTEGSPRFDDPANPARETSNGGGLWKLQYEDIQNPELGAKLTLLLDGSESWGAGQPKAYKPDNLGIDRKGNLLIQEDPGGADHLARILAYDVDSGARGVVATFDPAIFAPGATRPDSTIDEESSGIIDASSLLGRDTWLFDVQNHKAYPAAGAPGWAADPEGQIVQFGQLLTLKVKDWDAVYTIDG